MNGTAGLLTSAALVAVAPAAAEVLDAAEAGFTVRHEVTVEGPRTAAWNAAVDDVGLWWNGDHTVGGDASRLHIDARPLGCFCEQLSADDGVAHLLVTSVSSGVMLRMTGGLGPLGLMGVNGNMTWEFFDMEGETRIRFTYAVGGYRDGGLLVLAEPVDGVISEALDRLKAHIEDE
jgi:hypothetical protein